MKTEKEKFEEAIQVLDRHIFQFFASHPAISIQKFEKDIGLPDQSVQKFLKSHRGFPVEHKERLLSGMEKYGWDRLERWENDTEYLAELKEENEQG